VSVRASTGAGRLGRLVTVTMPCSARPVSTAYTAVGIIDLMSECW
jgi:hypothetical protein